ncbi:hypothetical protein ACHAC9_00315 [Massilia sp. CMS3.1]|uniref:hypothetical protein n=1 Tax=Massilia sp. CMS3.1 TaxID=3373083 RepID=UPI003EE4767E
MKKFILVLASAAVLAGCAAPGPGPANYGSRAYSQAADPNGWQVVSVTPVPAGTGARAGDAGVVTSSNVLVNPAPVVPGRSVYAAPPVYVPAPVYVQDPYWYPPVSIGLGFSFGRSFGGHHHHRGGGYRRR